MSIGEERGGMSCGCRCMYVGVVFYWIEPVGEEGED
jgi:hypothetical protein